MRKISTILGLFLIITLLSGNSPIGDILSSHYNIALGAENFIDTLPEYNGTASIPVNNNCPYFTDLERALWTAGTEVYSELDALNRCGPAYACIGLETMPRENETRGTIGMIKPSGWHTVKYPELIDDLYLYNRCHLIGWQLGNENANEKNLITGTRYLNVTGMLPYENMAADYVRRTGNHVLYRVTPVFCGNDLVARGVLIEAESVETTDISFCVWCYNVQPGIEIDYATGNSVASNSIPAATPTPTQAPSSNPTPSVLPSISEKIECEYILNTNTKRIHLPSCSSVNEMKPSNRREFNGDPSSLLDQGYKPCGRCHPF